MPVFLNRLHIIVLKLQHISLMVLHSLRFEGLLVITTYV